MTTKVTLGPGQMYAIWADGTVWDRYWDRAVTDPELIAEVKAAAQAQAAERAALVERAERGRRTYVRFGAVPAEGRSWNHMDGHAEAGVSVYAAWVTDDAVYVDLRGGVSVGVLMFSADALHEVTGALLDTTGSDGEPLLSGARSLGTLDLPREVLR